MTTSIYAGKMIYIPYMCDHVYVVAAGLESVGLTIEVLPHTDDATFELGLEQLVGKECSPCFTTTGDILRLAQRPGFDPTASLLLMPTAGGPCRFGQYRVVQRDIMDDHGLQAMEIVSLTADNSYQGFGDNPTQFRALLWDAVVLVDLLQRLLFAHRPYEVTPGQADATYQEGLRRVTAATRGNGGKLFDQALDWIVAAFTELPIRRDRPRLIIALVGEIYLRFNDYGNQDIIRKVEAVGGEVVLSSMMEWLYFTNWEYIRKTKQVGRVREMLTTQLTDLYQRHREHRFARRVAHLLPHPYEATSKQLMQNLSPYYDTILGTEAVLTLGEAIEMAKHGASGILNVMPFSCMPGIISAGLAPRIRADFDNLPWLDVVFDAQGGTNLTTRLEAFIYQAAQYHHRRAGQAGGGEER